MGADVGRLRESEQVLKAGIGSEVEDPLGVVGRGIVHLGTTTGGGRGLFQLGALGDKAHLGEAQEDDPKDRPGVFLRF